MSVCYEEQYTKKFLYTAGGTEHRKNKIQQNKAMVVYKTKQKKNYENGSKGIENKKQRIK